MVESNLLINKLFAEHHSSISKNNTFVEYQNKDFLPHRKIYAFYLPQFHEMSINNIQWKKDSVFLENISCPHANSLKSGRSCFMQTCMYNKSHRIIP